MLSFNTVHALVDHLMQLNTAPTWLNAKPFRGLGTIAVVHDHPLREGAPDLRCLRVLQLPLRTDHRRHQTLPAALHQIADSLTPEPTAGTSRTPEPAGPPLNPFDLDILRQQVHQPHPGLRLLAWAVCYDDLLADADTLTRARRVEAIDADGRVYQLSRTAGEAYPVVLADEQPDPADLPTTYPALAHLAAASATCPT